MRTVADSDSATSVSEVENSYNTDNEVETDSVSESDSDNVDDTSSEVGDEYESDPWIPLKAEATQQSLSEFEELMQNFTAEGFDENEGFDELLPLSYDREMKDLVFFFKALYGYVDLNINNCVSFIQHGRTRLSQATGVMLQTPMCRTATFQSSYFNRIVKPWNNVCHDVNPDTFSSPISFKNFLKRSYLELLRSVYDVDLPCTWFSVRDCPCHREQRK